MFLARTLSGHLPALPIMRALTGQKVREMQYLPEAVSRTAATKQTNHKNIIRQVFIKYSSDFVRYEGVF